MTFFSIKCSVLSVSLGAILATSGYLLSTASYVGSASSLILAPKVTDSGTLWTAENEEIAVEVRYISSVIETPAITIRKKQQWRKLAVCMASGILLAYACYRLMMRKAPKPIEPPPADPTPVPGTPPAATPAPETPPTEPS